MLWKFDFSVLPATLVAAILGLAVVGLSGRYEAVLATHARLSDLYYLLAAERDTSHVVMLLLPRRLQNGIVNDRILVPELAEAISLAHKSGARAVGVSIAIKASEPKDNVAFVAAAQEAGAILAVEEGARSNSAIWKDAEDEDRLSFLNANRDSNSVIRRIDCCIGRKPKMGQEELPYLQYSFGLRMAAAAHATFPVVEDVAMVRVGPHLFRFERESGKGTQNWMLRLRYPGSVAKLHRVEGLEAARRARSQFRGKTVVIGLRAVPEEFQTTPLGRWEGAEIQAAAVASLTQGDYLQRLGGGWRWAGLALQALLAALGGALLTRWRLALVPIALTTAAFAAGQALFSAGILLDWSEFALAGIGAFGLSVSWRTDWASRLIHTLTGLRRPQTVGWVDAAIFISDARGSSKAAVEAGPEKNKAAIDRLYAISEGAVRRCGGMVNKYMGDGMLAVFQGPGKVDRALACALDLLASDTPLPVGVAIHSGNVYLGFVGDGKRKDFTVLGDVVNITARMESCNKKLGTELLLSDEARNELSGDPHLADLGEIELEGTGRKMRVHTIRKNERPAAQETNV